MSALNIRIAKNTDSENIKNVVFSVLNEYGLEPAQNRTDTDLDDVEHHYINNGGYFGVIEDKGRIVATLGLYKLDQRSCELRKMYVLQKQRGKGLGRELMDFSLVKARELGFKRVVLETAYPFVEAIGLYKKYGFTEYFPEHLSSSCDQAFELEL